MRTPLIYSLFTTCGMAALSYPDVTAASSRSARQIIDLMPLAAASDDNDERRLKVLAVAGPTTVRMVQGKTVGFHADLLRQFATSLNRVVALELVNHPQQLPERLGRQNYDFVIGAPLSAAYVKDSGLRHITPLAESTVVAISRRSEGKLANPANYVGHRIAAVAGGPAIGVLQSLSQRLPLLRWQARGDRRVETLLEDIETGALDIAFVDANTAEFLLDHHPGLRKQWVSEDRYPIAWAFSERAGSELLSSAQSYFETAEHSGELNWLRHRHFGSAGALNNYDIRVFHKRLNDKLPEYRQLFIKAGHLVDLDWRLLAALSYQESLWNPDARSFTGVRGIMQLTQDTAASLEADPKDTHESVIAGAKYLRSLYDRLPERISEPDRTWFALAAYNIGLGHVYDARALARKQGANPDHWINTRRYIGLLDSPKWYAQTKHGKARGDEAVRHVYRIRRLYSLLQGHEQRQRSAYAKAADIQSIDRSIDGVPKAWQRLFALDINPLFDYADQR